MDQVIVYGCVVLTVVLGALDPALHRGRPEGPGHGRLAGNDRPCRGRAPVPSRSGCGRWQPSSPAWPACSPPRSSGSTPTTSPCSSRPPSPRWSPPACARCPSPWWWPCSWGSPPRSSSATCPRPATGRPRSSTRCPSSSSPWSSSTTWCAGARSPRSEGTGGALDRAITPQGGSELAGSPPGRLGGGLAGAGLQVRRAPRPHRRHRRPPPARRGLLGGPGRPGLRLRHHLLVVDPGHRRGGHALALPGDLRRRGRPHHRHPGHQPRVAGAGGDRRRGPGRPADGAARRPAQHPPGRPLRGHRHPHLRPADGEPGLHSAELRQPGPRSHPQPPRLRLARPRLRLSVPGRLRHHRPVHLELCAARPPGSP